MPLEGYTLYEIGYKLDPDNNYLSGLQMHFLNGISTPLVETSQA